MKKLLGAAMIGCMLTGTVLAQDFIFRRPLASDLTQSAGSPSAEEPAGSSCDTTPVVFEPGVHDYTLPDGCSRALVQAWGAGAMGKDLPCPRYELCYGGGGGSYAEAVVDLVPGEISQVIVGEGGHPEQPDGGLSSFAGVLAYGGQTNGNFGVQPKNSGSISFNGGYGGSFRPPDGEVVYASGGGGGAGAMGAGGMGETPAGGADANASGGTGGRGGGGSGGDGRQPGQAPGGGGGSGGGFGGDGRVIITPDGEGTSLDLAIVLSGDEIPVGRAELDYSFDFSDNVHLLNRSSIGVSDLEWRIEAGSAEMAAPPGLVMDSSTGKLSGTPLEEGDYIFRVVASYGNFSGRKDYRVKIKPKAECDRTPVILDAGEHDYSPPEGCGFAFVQAWGGGGGGASASEPYCMNGIGVSGKECSAGGGGAYAEGVVAFDVDETVKVVVGRGGSSVEAGEDGQASTIKSIVAAAGKGGGVAVVSCDQFDRCRTNVTVNGAGGGSAQSFGDLVTAGGAGAVSRIGTTAGSRGVDYKFFGGGGASGGALGAGGAGGNPVIISLPLDGSDGEGGNAGEGGGAPGGAGKHAGSRPGGGGGAGGGNGGDGRVIIFPGANEGGEISEPGGTEEVLALYGPSTFSANEGQPFSIPFAVTGGTPPLEWSISPALPDGVSLTPGSVSGTAAAGAYGPFTLTVSDNSGKTDSVIFELSVIQPLVLLAREDVKEMPSYAYEAAVLGGVPPYVISFSGNVPAGIADLTRSVLFRSDHPGCSPCFVNQAYVDFRENGGPIVDRVVTLSIGGAGIPTSINGVPTDGGEFYFIAPYGEPYEASGWTMTVTDAAGRTASRSF